MLLVLAIGGSEVVGIDVLLRARVLLLEVSHEFLCLALAFFFCILSVPVSSQVERYGLFKSTMATSAPEMTQAWLMTSPNPRAPPVTTATPPSSVKEANVLLK